jgi:hypothetical protein
MQHVRNDLTPFCIRKVSDQIEGTVKKRSVLFWDPRRVHISSTSWQMPEIKIYEEDFQAVGCFGCSCNKIRPVEQGTS